MSASQHDLRLSAALIPLAADVKILHDQLTFLASDLMSGDAPSKQRLEVDDRVRRVAYELQRLSEQLIPGAPITIESADGETGNTR